MQCKVYLKQDFLLQLSARFLWALLFSSLLVYILIDPLAAQESNANTQQATALIVSPGLNVRSGPGLSYVVIGYVKQGDSLEILAQTENCRWLQVRTAKWGDGWISGKASYATINVACAQIGGVSTAASAQPAATGSNEPTVSPVLSNAAAATTVPPAVNPTLPPPVPTPIPVENKQPAQNNIPTPYVMAPPPAGQGCYLLQNRLGPPITMTFTNRQSGKSVQVIVPHGTEVPYCTIAGEYTYTISAVGFKDQNGEMKVIAGDAFMVPIGAQ